MCRFFRLLFVGTLALFIVILFMKPSIAGPGGNIASLMFRTFFFGSFWGKIILACLVILFLPFIIYTYIKELIAQRCTLKDLSRLARISDHFDWLLLRDRITDSFFRIHNAWRKEDMKEASEWMTDWYWKNQQITFLDQWASEGLVNHCKVNSITNIKPLFLSYHGKDIGHEGSRIVISINAVMEDYLAKRDTGEVVEGKKGFFAVETVWTFLLKDKKWRVANIEDIGTLLEYALMINELPERLNEVVSS